MESNAQQLASKMKLGINIGNTMEAYGCTPAAETCWGNPTISAAYIKLIKDSGFDAVRLPVSWNQYADQATAKINPTWLAHVKQVVQYAVDNDLYIIVNIHWDGGWLDGHINVADQASIKSKQKAFWEQIATEFREFDEHVIFASANEPPAKTAAEMTVLHSYHQTFVDAVRSTGGRNAYRVLVVQGPSTNVETTRDLWQGMPSDTATGRQMAEIHFYGPYNFGLMDADASWGKMSYYWGIGFHSTIDTERNATWGEEDWVNQEFDIVKAQFTSKGIPVVMGEYGAMYRDKLTGDALTLHTNSHAYFYQYVTQRALAAGLIPFMWEQGSSPFQLFDRNTPTLARPQLLDAVLIGAGKKSSSSSSSPSSSTSSSTSSTSSSTSSASSSSSSSVSNVIVLDTNPSSWTVDNGVVKNEAASNIQFTLNATNQAAAFKLLNPVNWMGATLTLTFNFDQAFVSNRSGGMDGILQFYTYSPGWASSEFKCWTGWTALVADQDITFSCSAFGITGAEALGVQFFATAGTVTIKSAAITLAP